MGAVVSSGAAVMGSGAFSAVEANRSLTVEMETDKNAYLRMRPSDANFAEVDPNNGQVKFAFDDDWATPGVEGKGLGKNSVYEFEGVLYLQNQGSRTVRVFGQYTDDAVEDIGLIQSTDVNSAEGGSGDLLTEENPSDPLEPGDEVEVGFVIDTSETSLGDKQTSMKITAVSDDSDLYD